MQAENTEKKPVQQRATNVKLGKIKPTETFIEPNQIWYLYISLDRQKYSLLDKSNRPPESAEVSLMTKKHPNV